MRLLSEDSFSVIRNVFEEKGKKEEEEKEDISLEQSSSTVWPKRLVYQGLQAVREFETEDFTENHIMDTAIPRL